MLRLFFFPQKGIDKKWFKFDGEGESSPHEIPGIVWIYWDSEKKSYLVELCIDIIKGMLPEYTIRVLDKKTISNYISIDELSDEILIAHKSDYIRLKLLQKYGGVWIDASIILTKNLDWLMGKIATGQVFVFYSDECTLDFEKPITENWFIIADKNNKFISDWLSELKVCFQSNDSDCYYDFIKENKSIMQSIPNISYLKTYVAASYVLSKKKYNILCLNSGSTGHYYNYNYISNSFLIALSLCLRPASTIYVPEIIKLTNGTRKWLEILIKNKVFFKSSVVGQLWFKYSRYK